MDHLFTAKTSKTAKLTSQARPGAAFGRHSQP